MSLDALVEPVIILAEDLTPSDTAQLDKSKVLGFATEVGGPTSHVAIMARSLELPAIVGCGRSMKEIEAGELVVLDASMGTILRQVNESTIKDYEKKISVFMMNQEALARLKDLPAETIDGHKVELC